MEDRIEPFFDDLLLNNMTDLILTAKQAKKASLDLAVMVTDEKNRLLLSIADELEKNRAQLFAVNAEEGETARKACVPQAFTDRLTLNDSRFKEMVEGVRKVAMLNDPVGRIFEGRVLENGLKLYKKSVPLGVVGVIYESRPNVTVDIAALCLKSGNACILRGGSECFKTNRFLHSVIEQTLSRHHVNINAVSFVDNTDREQVSQMLTLDRYIDVLIPRGGEKLQRRCQKESSIPVIIGGFGISHIFVDESADLNRSLMIVDNAKTQKPSACNSLDTLLVHESVAARFIPMLCEHFKTKKVAIVAHGRALDLCGDYPYLEKGDETYFDVEFLALRFNLKIVENVQAAAEHMVVHNASHSDSILSNSNENIRYFVGHANSACVYVNAPTSFSDGAQFGLGAEVGISTQKMHPRGPMGLEEITTYKWLIEGDGQTRPK